MTEKAIFEMLESTGNMVSVHHAAIKALIATHPAPEAARLVAESLLMQQHSTCALTQPQTLFQPALAKQILDSLFQPPTAVPPDAD